MAKKLTVDQLNAIMSRFRTGVASSGEKPGKNSKDSRQKGIIEPESIIQGQDANLIGVSKTPRKATIILTPFMGEDPSKARLFERYANRAVKDSLNRNEAPLASQLFFFSFYNNNVVQIERDEGLMSQLTWVYKCDRVAVYSDFGITQAMSLVLDVARLKNKPVEFRAITSFA